jgi:cyanate lyase
MQENEILTLLISSGVLVAVVGLCVSLVKLGKVWVDAKTAEITARIKNNAVADALRRAEESITYAVVQTAQVEADAFKAAAEDGKLTESEMRELRDIAMERAKSFITDDLMSILTENIKDVDAWIVAQIETNVRSLKQ